MLYLQKGAALECIITVVTGQPSPRLWYKYDACWKRQRIRTSFVPDTFPCAGEPYNIQVLVHNYSTCRRSLFCVQRCPSLATCRPSKCLVLESSTIKERHVSKCPTVKDSLAPKTCSLNPGDEVDGTVCTGKLLEWLWNGNKKMLPCTLGGWNYAWTSMPDFLVST